MDAFDSAYPLKQDLESVYKNMIPLHMITDSTQLFDSISKGKRTTEKRLSIDITAAREAYKNYEKSRICLLHGDQNPADALSKVNGNQSILSIMAGRHATEIAEWLARKTAHDDMG